MKGYLLLFQFFIDARILLIDGIDFFPSILRGVVLWAKHTRLESLTQMLWLGRAYIFFLRSNLLFYTHKVFLDFKHIAKQDFIASFNF